jgi:hypothetical protein
MDFQSQPGIVSGLRSGAQAPQGLEKIAPVRGETSTTLEKP